MIKAIIFDCFGVLVTEGWEPFSDKYFSSNPTLKLQAKELAKRHNLGELSYDEFITEAAKLAEVDETSARQVIDDNAANTPLLQYIKKELKPKFKIGFLSNAGGNWLDELFSKEEVDLFDDVVLSFEVGHIKPDARIYRLAADRLDVKPEEAVLIDDRRQHIEGAYRVGMKAIFYENFEQMKAELEKLLAVK